ncbi:Crp/Fnr family transcriptional regulator [Aquimarina intermedia]|uniref:CRP-like cAMP-binding protein n=1 Tax=Aquimarina intermedia TaxID=350814 RepID=A0A5S5C0T5_9FLAO|nr:Crp/Fnr family transcriptional regulator [Aquimarina intermedia]TYP72897.1 CRP-like cAMP-binding protein [Aquimarina intermedia]
MKAIWFFENTNLLNLLCPHKFKKHKENHRFLNFRKYDYIYFESDAATKIYLIVHGKIKIGAYTQDGSEIISAILSKGEVFGEKAILGEVQRTDFAQAMDNTTSICPIGVDTMHEMMRANKSFSLKIYKFIGLRFQRMERRLHLLLFKDTKTRLLEFLNDLKEDYGHYCPKTGDMVISHPYTQKEIANLIGTSRPTLNILLNELKKSKYIDFYRSKIRIKITNSVS